MTPSTPSPAAAGALADEIERCPAMPFGAMPGGLKFIAGLALTEAKRDIIVAALRNSAPQETRETMDYGQELLRWSNIEIALRKKFPTLAATGTEIDGWPDLIIALQETRGDEPVAWQYRYEPDLQWHVADAENYIPKKSVHPELEVRPLYAAPQPSPRLEREVIADLLKIIDDLDAYQRQPGRGDYGVECACCMGELFDKRERAVIESTRALLSPDATVVTSTGRAVPGFTQCSRCWQPATCKKYGCSEPVSSKLRGEVK